MSIQFKHLAYFNYVFGTKKFKPSEPKANLKPCFKLRFATTGEPLVCDGHCLSTVRGF